MSGSTAGAPGDRAPLRVVDNSAMSKIDSDNVEVAALRAECDHLRTDNARLRSLLALAEAEPPQTAAPTPRAAIPSSDATVTAGSGVAAKLALYRTLFCGREDVFALRWQSKAGKSGYSPACAHEWDRGLCDKPTVKCAECTNRALLPITDAVLHDHLTGRHTIGIYPLLLDESCNFLALDFDKAQWRRDVAAFLAVCAQLRVPAYAEISRSGQGAHVCVFFAQAIPAAQARRLGSALLTNTTAPRHGRSRLLRPPLPRGHAAQGRLRQPHRAAPAGPTAQRGQERVRRRPASAAPDQWQLLSRRSVGGVLTSADSESALESALQEGGDALGERIALADEDQAPWTLPPSKRHPETRIQEPFPKALEVVSSNLVYVAKDALPQGMQDRLVRLAAFENPEFYRAQAMRLPTFAKPRLICCAEEIAGFIALPRGCLDDVLALLASYGIAAQPKDERFAGQPLEAAFAGELTAIQQEAALRRSWRTTAACSARRHRLRQDGRRRLAHRRARRQYPCPRDRRRSSWISGVSVLRLSFMFPLWRSVRSAAGACDRAAPSMSRSSSRSTRGA